eukprot:1775661-Prymnesium_polylepis.1
MSSLSAARRDAKDIAKAVCATFGFGESGDGVFVFFVIFEVSLLLSQLIVGFLRFSLEGNLPMVLVVARAHSISPYMMVQRVAQRRQV